MGIRIVPRQRIIPILHVGRCFFCACAFRIKSRVRADERVSVAVKVLARFDLASSPCTFRGYVKIQSWQRETAMDSIPEGQHAEC